MFLRFLGKTLALSSLLLAAGCTSTGDTVGLFPSVGGSEFKIESTPSGAEVYVMGEKVGVTPLQISQDAVFPNTYPKERESLYGSVTLKKAGCSDLIKMVSTKVSSAGLRVRLDCGDMSYAPTGAPRTSETAEQRLDKIKDLLNKGLITDEEAKKAREHVLGDL